MATIVYVSTSMLSLFFSFIFAAQWSQRKEWSHSFIGLSLFFYSLASLSLSVGHVFSWYTWTLSLFTLTYALVFPLLLGGAIYRFVHKLKPDLAWQVCLAYISLLFILVLSILTKPEPLVSWLVGTASGLFILLSVWLWLSKEGEAWFWLAMSGGIGLILQFLSTKELLGITSYSLLWLLIFVCLWRALSIDFPLDLAYEQRNREERPQRGEVSWKEV